MTRPNVDTYPIESVRAAMRLASAIPEDREAARREWADTMRREAEEITAGLTASAEERAARRRRVTFLTRAARPSPEGRTEDAD